MAWAKLDDAILDNRKIASVGMLGFAMHVAAITWCSRNLTDGFIHEARVACLFDLSAVLPHAIFACTSPEAIKKKAICSTHELDVSAAELAASLVNAGLWRRDEAAGGYWLNDYLVYNPTRESVLAQREKGRERAKVSAKLRGSFSEAAPKLQQSFARTSRAPDPDPVREREEEIPPLATLGSPQGDGGVVVPRAARVAKLKARTFMTSDWEPSPEAVAKFPGIDVAFCVAEVRDYWLGVGKPMANWDAVWCNRVRELVRQGRASTPERPSGIIRRNLPSSQPFDPSAPEPVDMLESGYANARQQGNEPEAARCKRLLEAQGRRAKEPEEYFQTFGPAGRVMR